MKDKKTLENCAIYIQSVVQINNESNRAEFTIGKCKVVQGNHQIDKGIRLWVDFEVGTKEA